MDQESLFELFPDPAWIIDRESLAILAANPAAQQMLGYGRDQLTGMTLASLCAADAIEAVTRALAGSGSDDQNPAPVALRHGTGRVLHAQLRWQPMTFQGRPAALGSLRDVTRLAEQVAHLRVAQRLLGIGLWQMDLAQNRLTWSPSVYEMYGVTADRFDHTFDGYVALVHPEDRPGMLENYQQFASSSAPVFEFEHRIVHDHGTSRRLRGIAERTQTPGGETLVGVVQDLTDTEQPSVQLLDATRLIRLAGRAAGLGGWRVDLNPQRITWTTQTALIHEEPPGTSPDLDTAMDYYAPEFRQTIREAFDACVQHGEPFDQMAELITAKGNRVWVRAIGEPERDTSGNVVAVQGAFQDISELVAAREESEGLARRLADTLESISDAFYTLDRDWRITYLNSEAERVLRQPRAELLGVDVREAFPDAMESPFATNFRRARDQGETVRFTDYYPRLESWLEVSVYPVAEGLAVYFRDVTAERSQADQLRLLQTAVDRQNDILLITEAEPIDAPDGPRIVYVNDAFVRRTGYAREDVIGKTPRLLQGPKTQRDQLDRIREALEAWQPVRAELINYTKGGEEFWLELDIVPLADESGWYTHWVSIERDVTERKHAEEALRVSNERFNLVARATSDTIWDWDLTTGAVWWNEGLLENFGYDPAVIESGHGSWVDHIHPDDTKRVLENIQATIEGTGSNWDDEYRFRHADGRTLMVRDRGFVIRDEHGRPVRVVGSMVDVSAQREQEDRLRQSQKLEAVGQLTGGVAHDFNNLLTVILGNAELLSERLTGQQQLRMLAEMTATAAERGAELTNRLLAFARRQALQPQQVDVNRLVVGMDALLRRTLAEDIDIELVQAGGLWTADVDPGQLEVALLNLAINARDAMPGGGRLTIETANSFLDDSYADLHDEVDPGQYVLISVSDTGVGMPPEVAKRAFEPFFTTKDVGKGSGLGLSMVYGFVKQSGGHAKIYSESDVGTTVKLYFPRSQSERRPAPPTTAEDAVTGGSEHILVVEDDALVREHLIAQLKGLGYRVTGASNGTAALALLAQHADVDLLFTDVVMPGGMNGRQLADAARASRPGLKVLFTSGYTENAIVHQGRLDPGVNLLSKPYRRQELAAKVRKVLDHED
ncbi:MAG: PAS domain S-box protein [Pseudomonadales bacterium]